LAGHGAEAVRDAIGRAIITLPRALRRSLTWDQGAEMTQHARLRIDTGLQVYFCGGFQRRIDCPYSSAMGLPMG
jgi:IS30 family transposase